MLQNELKATLAEAARTQSHITHVPAVVRNCSTLLEAMFDERRCLFAYSTKVTDGSYVNDFSHPGVYRYTINSLTGIQRAKAFHKIGWSFDQLLDGFLALHWSKIDNAADDGLLLYVLASADHPGCQAQLDRIASRVKNERGLAKLNLQDLSWMLAGLTKYAELTGDPRAAVAARACFQSLHQHCLHPGTHLPSHSIRRYRRAFSSFGGVAYFLWSVYHFARVFNDRQARGIFQDGVRQIIALQGRQGEWPWFLNASDATVLDWYQLYSVHQDAMAMLFLFPALDSGISEAQGAIEKSYRWLFGHNELQKVMMLDNPFFIYRSIRRKTKFERQSRYVRALASSIFGLRARTLPATRLEINTECRSYHIGWLLFAWAGRNDFQEFSELRLLKQ